MQNQHSQRRTIKIKYLWLILICFVLASCGSGKQTPTETPTQVSPTEFQTATTVPTPELPTSEPTQTLAPIITPTPFAIDPDKSAGLIVLAMGDGIYTHLFVFGPDSLPMTRLTEGNWDDEDPAISPDGSKVAFSSNRYGQWDIFILDLLTGDIKQVTQSKTYDGSPAWSPDGQYLIYQTLNDPNLDLVIQSVNDPGATPIQLTENSGDNFEPAWSPDGHTIAFISTRNGQSELWLADLQSVENRFTLLRKADQTQFQFPGWSPDGTELAWCQQDPESHIEILSLVQSDAKTVDVGLGCRPNWSADGTAILATLDQPNSHYVAAYKMPEMTFYLSPIQTTSGVQAFDWMPSQKSTPLVDFVNGQPLPDPTPLFSVNLSLPLSSTGRKGVVKIEDVDAPQAYLADAADESFTALRQGIGEKSGWDFLASLENAYLPLTSTGSPSITQNWLYTGRAIDVNTIPIDAGWMVVSREDFNGQTFWRVWIKCLKQDGSCGKPVLSSVWDFTSRFDSDPAAYENGGKLIKNPSGYWIDFTEFANRYGWERLPSQANWRYYYPGILFNQFIFSEGLTWSNAMLELYPPEAIKSLSSGK